MREALEEVREVERIDSSFFSIKELREGQSNKVPFFHKRKRGVPSFSGKASASYFKIKKAKRDFGINYLLLGLFPSVGV